MVKTSRLNCQKRKGRIEEGPHKLVILHSEVKFRLREDLGDNCFGLVCGMLMMRPAEDFALAKHGAASITALKEFR